MDGGVSAPIVAELLEFRRPIAAAGQRQGVVQGDSCEYLDKAGVSLGPCQIDKVFPSLTRVSPWVRGAVKVRFTKRAPGDK